jgi:predicted dehydrogenase
MRDKKPDRKKVRYGVVGAGWIAQAVFMPGIAATHNSELSALVTGDREKAAVLAKKYGLSHTYEYDDYDLMLREHVVDAVYIATPNWDHEDYAVRALRAGVHVLLEKPTEISLLRTERICAAAREALQHGTRFMVAYRLHFEPATLDAIARVRNGEFGEPTYFSSQFSQSVSPHNHRARHGFDAGPVPDMGPYPINAARNLFGLEPIEVSAIGSRHPEAGFSDFDDTVAVTLRFPRGKLAQFVVSYAASSFGSWELVGTRGSIEMSPAYTFQAALQQRRIIEDHPPELQTFQAVDQFAGETRYFSDCILQHAHPEPDAEEGMLDVRVIEAIRRALVTREPQRLEPRAREHRIDPERQRQLIAARKPAALFHAHAPEDG